MSIRVIFSWIIYKMHWSDEPELQKLHKPVIFTTKDGSTYRFSTKSHTRSHLEMYCQSFGTAGSQCLNSLPNNTVKVTTSSAQWGSSPPLFQQQFGKRHKCWFCHWCYPWTLKRIELSLLPCLPKGKWKYFSCPYLHQAAIQPMLLPSLVNPRTFFDRGE